MIQLKVIQDLRLDSGQRYAKGDVVSPTMSEAAWLLTKHAKHFAPEGEEATELNRKLKAGAASTTTTNTTSVAVTDNEWDLLEIYRLTNGNISFWVNEALVFTHTTNIPTSVMCNIGFFVETQTTAARNLQIDWLSLRTARVGQRYT